MDLINLTFKPVDLNKNTKQMVAFREDSFICSFGNAEKFFKDGGVDGYIEWIKGKIAIDSNAIVHAWFNDQIVGQIELGSYKLDASIAYVYLYYLIPEMRNRGLAKQLDDYAIKYFAAKKFKEAYLSVSHSNHQAIKFYNRMQWVNIGVRKDDADLKLMRKVIESN